MTLSLVWIVCSVHFDVTSIEALFLESGGVQNCLKAVAWTYMSGLSALFFYRQASFSRLMLVTSGLLLLGGILLLRYAFWNIVMHSNMQAEPLRVIILGPIRSPSRPRKD